MVKIRLKRIGQKKRPVYRVVVAESTRAREGRFIETIGHFNPCVEPPTIQIDETKALHWLQHGAQPTDTAKSLLRKQGILDKLAEAKAAAKAGA